MIIWINGAFDTDVVGEKIDTENRTADEIAREIIGLSGICKIQQEVNAYAAIKRI